MKKFVPKKGIVELGNDCFIEDGEFKTRINEGNENNKYLTLEEFHRFLKKVVKETCKMIVDDDKNQPQDIRQNWRFLQ